MCIQRMGFYGILPLALALCGERLEVRRAVPGSPHHCALRSYCICGSTCDLAVTSLTYPSALSFLMAVPGLCELMVNQCLLSSWM